MFNLKSLNTTVINSLLNTLNFYDIFIPDRISYPFLIQSKVLTQREEFSGLTNRLTLQIEIK